MARSVASGFSGGSATTPASLKLCMEAPTAGLQQLSHATADLNFALEAAGEGPWEGWPLLTETEIVKQLETQQDVVEDLLKRGETRRLELEQLEGLSEEDPALHNRALSTEASREREEAMVQERRMQDQDLQLQAAGLQIQGEGGREALQDDRGSLHSAARDRRRSPGAGSRE